MKELKKFDLNKWYKENYKENKNNFKEINDNLPNEKKTLIKISNLSKSYKKNKILNNINLEIRENENIAIVGQNGAGKTTLVEIVTGVNKKDSGSINYLFDFKKSPMEKIGIQFQGSSYPNGIKVKKILNFYTSIFKTDFNSDEQNILINIFGIKDLLNKNANNLSGGELQRLNALLSLLNKPKIIFLDEISTGLDIVSSFRIKKFIKDYSSITNTTIVLVSHDISEIEYIADRLIILSNSKIVVSKYIKDILKKTTLEKFISNYIF